MGRAILKYMGRVNNTNPLTNFVNEIFVYNNMPAHRTLSSSSVALIPDFRNGALQQQKRGKAGTDAEPSSEGGQRALPVLKNRRWTRRDRGSGASHGLYAHGGGHRLARV